MSNQSHKNRIGIVYSTSSDFEYLSHSETEIETLTPENQKLKLVLDKKARAGKKVTLIQNFIGKTGDLELLSKIIKTKCGVGGSVKDGEIIIQGDFRDKIAAILVELKYSCKVI
jgi:translation initiation factor 1